MILSISILLLALPLTLAYDRRVNFRARRMMMLQPLQRRNVPPFVIRVPTYSKVVPTNSLFAHSVAWRAKLPQVKSDTEEAQPEQAQAQQDQQPLSDPEIQQFQSQDTNGQVVFGFNSPDQMRIETRNPDGTVHGTYSYLDPFGQVIKRQYWDTGSGFHVTSNTYPLNGPVPGGQNGGQQAVPYTPEVQAARDLHFQLYQQALSSLLPAHGPQDVHQEIKDNNSTVDQTAANNTSSNEDLELSNDLRTLSSVNSSQAIPPVRLSTPVTNFSTSHVSHPAPPPTATSNPKPSEPKQAKEPKPVFPAHDRIHETNERLVHQNDDDGEEASDPETQNGSIVIENPEYLRISWTTDTKKYRLNLYNGTESNPNVTNKVQIRHEVPNVYNITKFQVRSRPK